MKFTVEIPDEDVVWANAEAVNRQEIAKFMREELQSIGNRFGGVAEIREIGPGISHEWRGWIFNRARVFAQKKEKPALTGIDAASCGR